MKFAALATDYDGTLAHDGRVDDDTLNALKDARAGGLRLLLVTGRELSDLANTFSHITLFDRVVAENGAVLLNPGTSTVRLLGASPPPALLEALTQRKVPFSVGHSIVATVTPHERVVAAAIEELSLSWHIIYNKHAVMVLPLSITKATGLAEALAELDIAAEETVGVGDAENDVPFLERCGRAVAVANALPGVIAIADLVTMAERGAGVRETIERLRAGDL